MFHNSLTNTTLLAMFNRTVSGAGNRHYSHQG